MRLIRMISAPVLLIGAIWSVQLGCAGRQVRSTEPQAKDLVRLRKQVDAAPRDVSLRLRLVRAYLGMDSVAAALGEARQAWQLDSSAAEVKAWLGLCEFKNGDREGGLGRIVVALRDSSLKQNVVAELGAELGHPYHIERIETGEASSAFPYPSPDGHKIAYQSVESGNWDIYVQDLTTGEKRRLTDSGDAEESPAFSPNGKVLAYTKAGGAQGQRDIYLTPVDGGGAVPAVVDSADDWYPRFSNDGKGLFFVSERDDRRDVPAEEKLSEIYLLDLVKKSVQRLTNNDYDDNAPAIFKGDRLLMYTANRGGHYDLFLMDLRKMKTDRFLVASAVGLEDIGSPAVTLDGKKLAFVGARDRNYDIYLTGLDRAAPQRLTMVSALDQAPVFSSDGERIFFHSNRSGSFSVYVIDLRNPVDRLELLNLLEEELATEKESTILRRGLRRKGAATG